MNSKTSVPDVGKSLFIPSDGIAKALAQLRTSLLLMVSLTGTPAFKVGVSVL